MAIVIPFSFRTKTTTYQLKSDGVFITEDHATGWIHFLVGIVIWFPVLALFQNVGVDFTGNWAMLIVTMVVAGAITVGILSFGIFRINSVQNLLHKRTIIEWSAIERVEMNKTKLKFLLKEEIYSTNRGKSGRFSDFEFSVKEDAVEDVKAFLSSSLQNRFEVVT